MNDEAELLRRYADDGSQPAFTELVRRTADLVYAAVVRQTGGDAQLAEEVTQIVFLALKAVQTKARWRRRLGRKKRQREAGALRERAGLPLV